RGTVQQVRCEATIDWTINLSSCVAGKGSPGIGAEAAGAGGCGARAGAGALAPGAAVASVRSRKAMMSCLVMRPPRPVPETCDKFTLCSRAIFRTNGDERAWSSSSRTGAVAGEGCCSTGKGAALEGAGAFFSAGGAAG